jgi:hypothetical protein
MAEYQARAKGGSKRRPKLTPDEMVAQADASGVGDLYRYAVDGLSKHFAIGTTRSTTGFKIRGEHGQLIAFNLRPFESAPEKGLHFEAYVQRLATYLGMEQEALEAALPANRERWVYADAEQNAEWIGCKGYFQSKSEIDRWLAVVGTATP